MTCNSDVRNITHVTSLHNATDPNALPPCHFLYSGLSKASNLSAQGSLTRYAVFEALAASNLTLLKWLLLGWRIRNNVKHEL